MTTRFGGPRAFVPGSLVTTLAGCGWGGNDHDTFRVPTSIAIADVNGDGLLDLALSTSVVRDDGADRAGLASIFLQSSSSRGTFQGAKDQRRPALQRLRWETSRGAAQLTS